MSKKIKLGYGRSNDNYICIDCRVSKKAWAGATCHKCGKDMECIGKKRHVPKANDKTGWDKLIWDVTNHPYYKHRHPEPPPPAPLKGKSPRPVEIKEKEKKKKFKRKIREHILPDCMRVDKTENNIRIVDYEE